MTTKISPAPHRNADGRLGQQQQLEEEATDQERPPLSFLSELYGRGIEQGILLQLYELFASSAVASSSSSSEVVLIHGRQGTGKTALGHSLGT
jgi:Cdc6-like AAA superfamily ATPase